MPKPEIIGSSRSQYARVACMAAIEKGVDYTLTETLLGSPDLFDIHPLGKMPVLRHGDFELFESVAIATYLDRSFPGPELFPSDPRLAALAQQWVSFVNTTVDPLLTRSYLLAYAAPRTADGKPDRTLIDGLVPAVRRQIEILDQAVSATGYLVGDRFSFADINLLPILYYVRMLPEGGAAFAAARNLAAYYEQHAQRPSFQATVPPPGPPGRYKPA